jgi:hypothetical protein
MLPIRFKKAIGIIALLFGFGGILSMSFNQSGFNLNLADHLTMNNDLTTAPHTNLPKACACITEEFPSEKLSIHEKSALLLLREEEKFAHDIFTQMHEQWNVQSFENIRNSEARHMDAVLCLIEKYDLQDPTEDRLQGEFKNQELAGLYKTISEKASMSLADAFAVGAMVAVWDLSDLTEFEKDINNKDFLAVITELKRSGRNHLRAMNRNLEEFDMSFSPVSIHKKVYKNIVNSAKEPGGKLSRDLGLCPGDHQPCQVVHKGIGM